MFSNLIRLVLALTGLAPILLILWLVKIVLQWHTLNNQLRNLIFEHPDGSALALFLIRYAWHLVFFFLLILICKKLMKRAVLTLSIFSLEVKSIKPSDNQFNTVLISYLLPFFKFYFHQLHDVVYLLGAMSLYSLLAFLGKSSYHHNLVIRLLLGYRHYEIQTRKEVTYLLLSKRKLMDPSEVTSVVQIGDYMIIHV